MVLRKRAKSCALSPDVGLSENAGTEERRSSNAIWSVKGSQASSEVDTGEASNNRRSNTCCNSELWPWQHLVSIAAGLLLAGLLALTQAWCVNSLHENLLWFSALTVRVIPSGARVSLSGEMTFFVILRRKDRFPVSQVLTLQRRTFRWVVAFNMDESFLFSKCGSLPV